MATRRRTEPLTAAAWEAKRDTIRQLYIDEGKALKEVREVLLQSHRFQVTYDIPARSVHRGGLNANRRAV